MATPMLMIAPISDGTLMVVWVTKSISRMPESAPGRAIRMMNGSSQDWKLTTMTKYTSTTAKTMPGAQADEGRAHGFHLAAGFEEAALGQLGTEIVQHAAHFAGHAAEVAILHVGVDVVERLHIVVIDNRSRGAAIETRHIGEQLIGGARAARMHGRIEQFGGGGHAVFGRLHDDGIVHAVLRIDPVIRRELHVAAQRDQQAVGDVLLGEAKLIGARAVHVEAQLGCVDDLVQVDVHRAGNVRQARGDLAGQRVVGGRVGERADHLHVDGRGQSEIEDLAHDIGRLEEEGEVGKLAVQAQAQIADVAPGGSVLRL